MLLVPLGIDNAYSANIKKEDKQSVKLCLHRIPNEQENQQDKKQVVWVLTA
jgi:hypothetical protein